MRKGVKLHPLLVLFGVFAGGELGGVGGIFLSVPIPALMQLVFYEFRKRHARRRIWRKRRNRRGLRQIFYPFLPVQRRSLCG